MGLLTIFDSFNICMEYRHYNSMDNYEILLEEFRAYEIQSSTSQSFSSVIDYIRNEKQTKKALLSRKRQEKSKLISKVVKTPQSHNYSHVKANEIFEICDEDFTIEDINNKRLKKQYEETERQLWKMRLGVKDLEQKIIVYTKKDNQIKQLMYSSKRQLDTILIEVKSKRSAIVQLNQKHEKVLEQLQIQKSQLEEENRYFANSIKNLKLNNSKLWCLKNDQQAQNLDYSDKTPEIYSKSKLEQNLRFFFLISKLKEKWHIDKSSVSMEKITEQVDNSLQLPSFFHFLSKNQTIGYYLKKLNKKSLTLIISTVIQLYQQIKQNIQNLQDHIHQLNNRVVELRVQYETLSRNLNHKELRDMKISELSIKQFQAIILGLRKNVQDSSCRIVMILEKFMEFYERLKRLRKTVDQILDFRSQRPLKISKKAQSMGEKRSSSNAHIVSSNFCSQNKTIDFQQIEKSQKSIENNGIQLKKKSMYSPLLNQNFQEKLSDFELVLKRNPKEIIFIWNEVIKDEQGFLFFRTVLENDLFRIFLSPYDYNPCNSSLQNEKQASKKVGYQLSLLLEELKNNIKDKITTFAKQTKQLQKKQGNNTTQADSSDQVRLVIESKGYFGRDNFKIAEKIEKIQLKKKGLYIPFRYGIDVEEQMIAINDRSMKEQRTEIYDKSPSFTTRILKKSSPVSPNYISSYRQKVSKADRKIRELLKNIDHLQSKKKPESQYSRSLRKISGRTGENSVL